VCGNQLYLRQPVHMVPKALSTEMSHIMDLIDKGYLQRGHLSVRQPQAEVVTD
jgi:hypothetical protein